MALLRIRDRDGNIIEVPVIQGGSSESVSYSQSQNLTDKQKETARNNINAVDASLVVSSLSNDAHIPNAAALKEYIDIYTGYECVRCDKAQGLGDQWKQTARTNIDAVSQAELDEAIANAGGSGTSEVWETIADITLEEVADGIQINQDTNGEAFSLKRAKIIVDTDNTTNFYTATGTLILNLLSAETGGLARAMYLTNFIPNTANKYSSAFFELEIVHGMAFVSGCCKNNIAALNNAEFSAPFPRYSNLPFAVKNGIINNIRFTTNHANGFAVGTHIKILGVRT